MRSFKLIEGSLYRTPLLLMDAEFGPPSEQPHPGQQKSYDMGYHHASRGYSSHPAHPKVTHPRAYLAGYAHQRQGKPSMGSTPKPPAPPRPAAAHPVHRTPAGQLIQKRKCFDQGETQKAVQGIDRSLASIKSRSHVNPEHESRIRALQQKAASAHPEDAHKHISQAVELMKPFYQKAPARPDIGPKGPTAPGGKDPRFGHLFYGTPKAPQQRPA
jgi:hypothetical protein